MHSGRGIRASISVMNKRPNHAARPAATPFLYALVSAVAIIEPLMTLPQVWLIWSRQSAQDVSLLSWVMSLAAAVVWICYGVQIRSKPLIVTSLLWIIVELMVVTGVVLYR